MWWVVEVCAAHVDSFNADLVMLYVKSTIKQTPKTKLEKRKYNLVMKFLPQNPIQKQVIKRCRKNKANDIIAHKLKQGLAKLPAKLKALCDDQSQHKLQCLTHGDFWSGNLLYKHVEKGEKKTPVSLKVIDWQLAQWNNPVFDLHYILNTSTTFKMRRDHTEEILQHYHDTFTKVTTAMRTPVPNWNYDQFKEEYERTSLIGLLCGVSLIQGTLSKAGEKLIQQRSNSSWGKFLQKLVDKITVGIAKISVSIAFKPVSFCIMKASIKKLLHPIGKELVKGSNRVMNKRLMDLLHEAYDNGMLDEMAK
ncbi:hypothetical protein Pcinc_037465 [Petrolisthes cinctipes]|uniref:CHK kinase-like domain-containing protein n=1 Tax=Petrolisthes cinctipes TaxID=88211 RepID=A0AAE1BSB2_PETCI|nr:hypothetical protein Pcinc_037465 [Petrolisthes cinctipes]